MKGAHMMKNLALTFMLALATSACPRPIPPPTPTPLDDAGIEDGGDPEEAKRPCLAACRRLAKLGCEAAKPTPEGTSCTAVCENIQSSGVVSLNIDCIKQAASCNEADRCNQKR